MAVGGECIGNGRIHVPSNTPSRPQETKIMIPDTLPALPDSCSRSVVVIVLTETGPSPAMQQRAHHSDPLLRTMLPSTVHTSERNPNRPPETATHIRLTKQLRPNLNSVSSRSRPVCCACRSRHPLQHCGMGRINVH